MKTLSNIFVMAAAAAMLVSCGASKSVEVGPYTVQTIEKGVYHIQDYNSTNPAGETFNEAGEKTHFNNCSDMYLLVGSEKALLIDLSNRITWADNADESLRQLVSDRIDGKPLTVTFTHNHGDHTGMLPAMTDFPGVTFALPRTDFQQLASRFASVSTEMYNEGYEFDLGDMKVGAVMVPGHTAGSMVFWLEGQDIIFTGDAIGSGHGVWIFDTDAYDNYCNAVPHLISFIEEAGINKDKLQLYGGHYWQKDWLDLPKGREMGWEYIEEMKELLDKMADGIADSEPSGLDMRGLDTYFRNHNAIIVWNAAQAEAYPKRYAEKQVFRNEDIVIRQIDEHTWEGNGHMVYNESVYLLEGSERALLIDAGTNIRDLDKIMATITDKPITLVATHVHGDHTGSAINLFPELWINLADTVNRPGGREGYKGELKGLTDGQIIDLGGRQIEVMFTPGHTPGSVTFFDKERHYGFSGDAFGSTNLLLTTGFKDLISTTQKASDYMKANGIEKLYPGHYHGDNPETLQRVLDLNKMAKETVSGKRKGEPDPSNRSLPMFINDYGVTVRYNPNTAFK